jgi:hypothetical protein
LNPDFFEFLILFEFAVLLELFFGAGKSRVESDFAILDNDLSNQEFGCR